VDNETNTLVTASHVAASATSNSSTLRRRLTAVDLTLIGVGATIGAGIFVLAGTTAAQWAGPAVSLSFVLAAIGCLCSALCYAELAVLMPQAGSAYTYSFVACGKFIGWLVGWNLVLEYLVCASTVSVGWSAYFVGFLGELGVQLPARYCNAPINVDSSYHLVRTGALFNLPAAGIVLLLTTLLLFGIATAARANNTMVWIKVGIVLLVIVCGSAYVHPANWHPYIPPNTTGQFGKFGFSGVLRGAALMFFAYIGFDTVSTLAQETKNPQRDLPIGLLASLAICAALYVGMAVVMTGMAPYQQLDVANPVIVALAQAGPALAWLLPLVGIGAIVGLASAILSSILGQSRIFYAMAGDGMVPKVFLKIHPRFGTPVVGTIVVGSSAALIAGVFPIEILGELVSIGTLLAFMSVCVNVMIMRRTHAEVPRAFRVPGSRLVPCIGIACCAILMFALPAATWIRLLVWMGIGVIIYFFLGRRAKVERPLGAPG
jgi:basic amino acid/polyamine antiporter, APA family